MKKKLLLSSVLFLYVLFFIGIGVVYPSLPGGKIKGVVQTEDETRLSGAAVFISGTKIRAITDKQGAYVLPGVPTVGRVLVMAVLEGFETEIKIVDVKEGETITVNFTLKLKELKYEVTVTSPKMPELISASKNIGELTFSPDDIATLPNLGERDIFRSIQLMPGVSGSNEASAGLYVRGGTPDKNLILYDGFTVYHVDHFFGVFSAFNPNAIDEVTLYKGGFESRYGGRLSSVMEITGKTGKGKGFNVGGGFSLLSFNALAEVPLGSKGSLLLTGRKSFKSPLYDTIFNKYQGESVSTMGPGGGGRGFAKFQSEPSSYFYDLNAKLTYNLSPKDVLFLSFFNGKDDLDNSRTMDVPSFMTERNINFNSDIQDVTTWGNLALSLNWHRQWNDAISSHAIIGYSNFFNNRDNSVKMDINREDETRSIDRTSEEENDVKDLTFRLDNVFKFSQWNQLELGLQITGHDIGYLYNYNNSEDGERFPGRGGITRISDYLNRANTGTTYCAYLQDRLTLFNKITLTPGIRATYFDVTKEYYYEPRFSLILDVSEKIKLKGAWGKYYQFVNMLIRENNMQGNREFWMLADDLSIPIGSSVHYIAGISYEMRNFLFNIEGYYKDLQGLSEFALRFAPSEGEIDYDDYFFIGTGYAKGIECLFQKKFGRFTGWLSYTLGKVEYDFPQYGDQPFPATHDVTHELKLIGSCKLNKWTFASTFIFATGRPYTEPVGVETITFPNTDRTFDRVTFGDKNTGRLPNYMRLDVSATYDFKLGPSKARIGLSFFNVLARTNVWRKEFEVVEGEIIETDVTYLGFTPNLSFTIYLK
jgi:hypothetical protein